MRGFNNSPRLIIALISDFLLQWNQNIDINIRGLGKKYDGLFVGQRLEDEIEKMGQWAERDTPPHPEWSLSSNIADTAEVFGIIDALSSEQIANNLDHDNPTTVARKLQPMR